MCVRESESESESEKESASGCECVKVHGKGSMKVRMNARTVWSVSARVSVCT